MDGDIDYAEYMEAAFKDALNIVKNAAPKVEEGSQVIAASNLALQLFNCRMSDFYEALTKETEEEGDT